jgi:hypothetical protein
MLAIRAYLLVDYQVNAEAMPDSIPPAYGTRPRMNWRFAGKIESVHPTGLRDGYEISLSTWGPT